MTALVRHGARFTAEFRPWPLDILARLDAYLRQQRELSLCTALCLRVDATSLTFASAGHPLPLLVTDDGVRPVGEAGPVLGAFPDSSWPLHRVELGVDETLLLYTDGVTDTVGADGRFGEHRLTRKMAECGPLAPGELLRCLEVELSRFQSGGQADDTAALALQRVAAAAEMQASLVEGRSDA
jgi:serine phosphatase RsbU (regulator of sigma subunit)